MIRRSYRALHNDELARVRRKSRKMYFGEFKVILSTFAGLERDALHIHGALLLYFVSMTIFRKSPRSRIPWLIVLGIELANEAYDLTLPYGGDTGLKQLETLKDFWNTMLWPTALLLIARYTNLLERNDRGIKTA